MQKLRRLLSQVALVVGVLALSIGLQAFAQTFSEPGTTPPAGNAPAPLNTSTTAQSKAGGLILNTGGATNGLIVQSGNVGIGTLSPGYLLDVSGAVRGTSLCIGTDCRTSWPGSAAINKNPAAYQCPEILDGSDPSNLPNNPGWTGSPVVCNSTCNGQLTTSSSCTYGVATGSCQGPFPVSCSFAGYLVQ